MLEYSPPQDLLRDRIILVTGAGDGIGRTAALSFARHGATVILLGRSVRKLEKVYDEIEADGGPQAAIVPLDLATATAELFDEAAEKIGEEFGRLDGLLHNAAELGTLTPLEHYDLAVWSRVMQVNLNAPFLLTRACLGLLRESQDASVVFTTADVARRGRAYWGAYSVAGFALEGLMQIFADELETNTRVRVNSLDPGAVRTNLRSRAFPGEDPEGLADPTRIMPAYLYLMGPDSRGTSGQALSAQD
jgi:NAD(P)-dependent dehydrogenase (short-subunit alcohol dehydrogenase family)